MLSEEREFQNNVTQNNVTEIESTRALTGIVAVYIVGVCWTYFMPLLVGCMVDGFGVRAGTAGIIMGIELGAMAVSCLVMPFVIGKIDVRLMVYVAAAAFLVGNIVSVWAISAKTWQAFVVIRCLTGFAEGCLAAVADATAAGRQNPTRAYGVMQTANIITAIAGFFGLMALVKVTGPAGGYITMGIVGLVAVPFLVGFPKPRVVAKSAVGAGNDNSLRSVLFNSNAVLLLLVGLFSLIGFEGVWTFLERMGVSINLSMSTITILFILALGAGVLGASAAAFLAGKIPKTLPIVVVTLIFIVLVLILVSTSTALVYESCVIAVGLVGAFYFTTLKGLPAFFDPTGRLNAVWAAPLYLGTALGPALFGVFLNAGATYKTIGWIATGFFLLTMALAFVPARRADLAARAMKAAS